MVPVPDRPGDRADQLEGRAGAAAGGREPEGVGRQPHGGRGARPRRADVGARDRPPTGAGNGRLHRCRLAGVWQPTHRPTGTATGTVNKYASRHRTAPYTRNWKLANPVTYRVLRVVCGS